ncbi:MAG TPA: 2-dehydropantoate 2-reductase [Solirubrobacteraceae bacterium]|nr:2-dehydropantoate 2-reductase [Solirubrobacteraceae bacterium]
MPSDHGAAAQIALVGPGAIGATLAAELQRCGQRCVICARSERPAITVEREGREPVRLDGPVLTDPAGLAPVRWLLVAVKAHQTAGAADWLRALADGGTTVLVLQNGIGQRELVGPFAPRSRIVPSVVWFPAQTVAPDRVLVHGQPRLTLPDDDGGRDVASLLSGTDCAVEVSARYEQVAWRKLAQNAVAGLTVPAGGRMGIFRRTDIADLARAYAAEIVTVARAAGVDLDPGTPEGIVSSFAGFRPTLGSSITYDHEAGRPLEWEARNEVVRRVAAGIGVATPISDVLVPLLAAASDAQDGSRAP